MAGVILRTGVALAMALIMCREPVVAGAAPRALLLAQADQPVATSPSVDTPPAAPAKKKVVKKPSSKPQSDAAPAKPPASPDATADAAKPNLVPPIELVVLMMRASLIALDQANKTNNYTVLRALSGPGLQKQSPEELSKTFTVLRDKQIDLSPILVTKPRMTANPAILPNGYLHLAALFPTKPLSIACVVEMQPVGGFWRLAGININLVAAEAQPVAAPPAKQP
jgi:hypothetical protein